jgi:hypothetical protein
VSAKGIDAPNKAALKAAIKELSSLDLLDYHVEPEDLVGVFIKALRAIKKASGKEFVDEYHILATAIWVSASGMDVDEDEVDPGSAMGLVWRYFAHFMVLLEKIDNAEPFLDTFSASTDSLKFLEDRLPHIE